MLPCMRETCSVPVLSTNPLALLQHQRCMARRRQPYRLQRMFAAINHDKIQVSHSPAHDFIVRDARDAPPFGPRGMLLVGFSKEHGDTARHWMQQMEPRFLVSHCTAAALEGTVEQAVAGAGAQQPTTEEHQHIDEVMPRLVLLSGVSGEEAVAIAEHWEDYTGTPPPIFCTLVDKLLSRPMRAAILDIVKAHVTSKRSKDGMVDTAALRQMIRRKMEEKQRAGACLVARGGGQGASVTIQHPVALNSEALHRSQGCEVDRKHVDEDELEACADKAATHTDAKQKHTQVAYAKRLLQAASPQKAQANEKEKRRKASKEKVVRKGFG